jgi:predicted SprT family Zn-dependent metalloprotease
MRGLVEAISGLSATACRVSGLGLGDAVPDANTIWTFREARPADGDRHLRAAAERAHVLLARHGLVGWTFAFNGAKRRGGACHFARRRITMAAGFATTADEAEIEDTLLHEIAHALVGRRHHHDAVWQAKARQIGCTAQRCHSVTFSEHPLVARCVNGCFAIGRHRSRRNMRCRRCGGAVVYAPAEPA